MDRKANGSPSRNIIAAAVIAAAAGGAGFMIGKQDVPNPAPINEIEVSPPEAPVPTVADVALERGDIIRLANEAADAASGGPAVQDPLEGRRFILRIPFGCFGPTSDSAAQNANYTVEDQVLRVRVLAQDWTALPWIANETSQPDVVAAEGFWIPRPWTRSEACPPGDGEPVADVSSIGIVQLFDSDSSRIGQRRGRALEATMPIDVGNAGVVKGLKLVLSGRVAPWPGTRETVRCNAAKAFERPVCLVGAKLDSISIENIESGEQLADWSF